MPKIIHYRDDCIGCHACLDFAPDNWEISEEDGKSDLKRSVCKKGVFVAEISDFEVEDNVEAARNCPMKIIKVLDDSGQEID